MTRTLFENGSQLIVRTTQPKGKGMSEVKEDQRRLVVNGQATTQEALRHHAGVMQGSRGSTSVERGLSAAILALLDLLEANQDLVEHLTGLGRALGLCYEGAAS